MRILVLVKQVPALDAVRFSPPLNRIERDGVPAIVNPLDADALAHALALRAGHGGEVVVATMGPPGAVDALTAALATGADRAVHVGDPMLAGADTLATARALARLVARVRPDLVLCGRSTIDGGTAQVGPQLAELAGLPQLTGATSLELEDGAVVADRELEGRLERWSAPLPALVTIEHPPARSVRSLAPPNDALRARVERVDVDDLGGDPAGYGIRGSATYVQRVDALATGRLAARTADLERAARQIAALFTKAHAAAEPEPVAAGAGPGELWALAQMRDGRLDPVSLECVAAAQGAAGRLSAALVAVLLCDERVGPASPALDALARSGASRVLCGRAPSLGRYATGPFTEALAALVGARSPLGVLAPWSAQSRDYVPRAAARLALGLTGDVVGLDVALRPGNDAIADLVWLKPAWAGTAMARVVARTTPAFGTLRPGSLVPPPPSATAAPVELVELELTGAPLGAPLGAPAPSRDARPIRFEGARAVVVLGPALTDNALDAALRWANRIGAGVAATPGAVSAGLLDSTYELSSARHALAPVAVLGIGICDPDELGPLRAAGTVVTVGTDLPPALRALADLAVDAAPEALLGALGA